MKKTVKKLIADVLIITTLISIFALAGCGVKNSDNANADVQDGVTFTDALGRSVTVKSADRTASLLGSFSDVWLLAGGKLVASVNDAWDSLDLGLDDSVVKLGAILEPNVELLIASQPDFVLPVPIQSLMSKCLQHWKMQELQLHILMLIIMKTI